MPENTNKMFVSGATELDVKVPIFNELTRNESDTHLSWSFRISLPKTNLNKGALLIEEIELYVHDT
jgi:hypothetical protein